MGYKILTLTPEQLARLILQPHTCERPTLPHDCQLVTWRQDPLRFALELLLVSEQWPIHPPGSDLETIPWPTEDHAHGHEQLAPWELPVGTLRTTMRRLDREVCETTDRTSPVVPLEDITPTEPPPYDDWDQF